jgi:hypothetical protein
VNKTDKETEDFLQLKSDLRCAPMGDIHDPFFEFQQSRISKSRLLQHIVDTICDEGFRKVNNA